MAIPKSAFALAAALSAALSLSAGAQSLATFGSAEAAGYGEGSLFLGSTLRLRSGQGLSPLIGAQAQSYRYRSGLNSHAVATAFAPLVGLAYGMPTGQVSGNIGYNFVNVDNPTAFVGLEGGNTGSVFTSLQANYWGDGNKAVQGIVSYAYRSEYVWSRLRAGHRIGDSRVFAGGEVVYQGADRPDFSQYRYQFGPTIEYRFTPKFRMGGAAGFRGGDSNYRGSGYAQINFLVLNDFRDR